MLTLSDCIIRHAGIFPSHRLSRPGLRLQLSLLMSLAMLARRSESTLMLLGRRRRG